MAVQATVFYPAISGGSVPTGTGFFHVTAGAMDAAADDASATQRVLGRNTAGSGDWEEVTATQITDWLGSTRGSILYRGAGGWTILAPGTSGHVLTSQGAGADPVYASGGAGAPTDAEYLTGAAHASLSAERVVTDTTTIAWDLATAAQAKANVIDGSISTAKLANDAVTYAKMQNVSATDMVLGRSTAGAGDVEEIAMTAAGRALVDDANAGAQRTTLGLGALATLATVGTAQIDDDAVTYAKIQDISATQRALARNTAGAGVVEEVTASQVLDWVGSTQGNILYRTGAAWAVLATGTAGFVLKTGGAAANPSWALPDMPVVSTLTDAATIATDASLGNVFTVTLGGNRTMGAPTNPTDKQVIHYEITQDGTGSRTLAWNAIFRFTTDIASPTLSTAAGTLDRVAFRYHAGATKWDVLAISKGYA